MGEGLFFLALLDLSPGLRLQRFTRRNEHGMRDARRDLISLTRAIFQLTERTRRKSQRKAQRSRRNRQDTLSDFLNCKGFCSRRKVYIKNMNRFNCIIIFPRQLYSNFTFKKLFQKIIQLNCTFIMWSFIMCFFLIEVPSCLNSIFLETLVILI